MALLAAIGMGAAAVGATDAPVELWRMDCGAFVTKRLTNSCYLVRHGDQFMLWDTGFGAELAHRRETDRAGSVIELRESLMSQLGMLHVPPERIAIVALSHAHFDHIGQAAGFPKARLLIGKQDWESFVSRSRGPRSEPARLAPWTRDHAPKELIDGDKDVFGDGSVVMVATPGHTPGHHSLLVRLHSLGPVLLTGDLYYSAAQYRQRLVPKHNDDAAATRASFARFDALAKALGAIVIIQHEPRDIAGLPAFPAAAE